MLKCYDAFAKSQHLSQLKIEIMNEINIHTIKNIEDQELLLRIVNEKRNVQCQYLAFLKLKYPPLELEKKINQKVYRKALDGSLWAAETIKDIKKLIRIAIQPSKYREYEVPCSETSGVYAYYNQFGSPPPKTTRWTEKVVVRDKEVEKCYDFARDKIIDLLKTDNKLEIKYILELYNGTKYLAEHFKDRDKIDTFQKRKIIYYLCSKKLLSLSKNNEKEISVNLVLEILKYNPEFLTEVTSDSISFPIENLLDIFVRHTSFEVLTHLIKFREYDLMYLISENCVNLKYLLRIEKILNDNIDEEKLEMLKKKILSVIGDSNFETLLNIYSDSPEDYVKAIENTMLFQLNKDKKSIYINLRGDETYSNNNTIDSKAQKDIESILSGTKNQLLIEKIYRLTNDKNLVSASLKKIKDKNIIKRLLKEGLHLSNILEFDLSSLEEISEQELVEIALEVKSIYQFDDLYTLIDDKSNLSALFFNLHLNKKYKYNSLEKEKIEKLLPHLNDKSILQRLLCSKNNINHRVDAGEKLIKYFDLQDVVYQELKLLGNRKARIVIYRLIPFLDKQNILIDYIINLSNRIDCIRGSDYESKAVIEKIEDNATLVLIASKSESWADLTFPYLKKGKMQYLKIFFKTKDIKVKRMALQEFLKFR